MTHLLTHQVIGFMQLTTEHMLHSSEDLINVKRMQKTFPQSGGCWFDLQISIYEYLIELLRHLSSLSEAVGTFFWKYVWNNVHDEDRQGRLALKGGGIQYKLY